MIILEHSAGAAGGRRLHTKTTEKKTCMRFNRKQGGEENSKGWELVKREKKRATVPWIKAGIVYK